jgi:hypothetical protein
MKTFFKSLSLLACLAVSSAWAAGDPNITLVVPLNMSKLPAVVKSVRVQCHLIDNLNGNYTPSNHPWANSPWYPVQNGSANVQAVAQITVPADQVGLLKGYSCMADMTDGSGDSPAGGEGLWWTRVMPGSVTVVRGALY